MPPPQGQPRAKPPHSNAALAALLLGLIGLLGGIFPFVGFMGLIAIVAGVMDLRGAKTERVPERHVLAKVGMVFGGLATLGAVGWVIFTVWFVESTSKGSCPHLYAWDGDGYHLDADLVSGALYKGAEREDMDRLESLRAVDGVYRVRIQDDLQEQDNVDSLALVVVDAPSDVTALPTQSGEVAFVSDLVAPRTVWREEGTFANGEPRESWTLTFARPASNDAVLVLHARTTAFAEKAFVEYMATMGQATRPLLEFRAQDNCACFREYMSAEMDRLGLPLAVTVEGTQAHARVDPIGPAVLRSQAVPITVPHEGDAVTIHLDGTPRFWDVDHAALGARAAVAGSTAVLLPARAGSTFGLGDVRKKLASADADRISLAPGQFVDVEFDAPPPPPAGTTRTVVAKLRGYYDLDIGGRAGANVPRMVAHRMGITSLPRYAARMPR